MVKKSDTMQVERSFGQNKILRCARIGWIVFFSLSATAWLVLAFCANKSVSADVEGVLHEPLFWLIPHQLFFLIMGVIMMVVDFIFVLYQCLWRKH